MREAEIDTGVNEVPIVDCKHLCDVRELMRDPTNGLEIDFKLSKLRDEVNHSEARIWLEMSIYYVLADQANPANLKHAKPLLLSQTFSIQYNDPHITNGDFCVYS